MNIICSFCRMPFALSRVEMLDALQEMDAKKLSHYDAHCPHCRRANAVDRRRIEIFFPNWRDALQQFEAEMKAHPQQEATAASPAPEAGPVKQAESTPEPVPAKTSVKRDTKAKPSPIIETGRKPAARSELGRKPRARNSPKKK